MSQSNLNLSTKSAGPVECLGQKFPSEEARREHYLKLLAQKLKDPEFRKIEGFPIGKDEDILALSDPPTILTLALNYSLTLGPSYSLQHAGLTAAGMQAAAWPGPSPTGATAGATTQPAPRLRFYPAARGVCNHSIVDAWCVLGQACVCVGGGGRPACLPACLVRLGLACRVWGYLPACLP